MCDGGQTLLDSLELGLWAVVSCWVWVVGTRLGSFGRATGALNSQASLQTCPWVSTEWSYHWMSWVQVLFMHGFIYVHSATVHKWRSESGLSWHGHHCVDLGTGSFMQCVPCRCFLHFAVTYILNIVVHRLEGVTLAKPMCLLFSGLCLNSCLQPTEAMASFLCFV